MSSSSAVQLQGFDEFGDYIRSRCGIVLNAGKETLVQTRLQARLTATGSRDLRQYLTLIQGDQNERKLCTEALTTHKTQWFREIVHYQFLAEYLKGAKTSGKKVRLWSAAASSGQEAYSMLFLCIKLGMDPGHFQILATDLSKKILDQAMALPDSTEFKTELDKLSLRMPPGTATQEIVARALQQSIKFKEFNLLHSVFESDIKFDFIFLRNVLIYFDRPTILSVCRKLAQRLKPDGYLVLGLSESLQGEVSELVTEGNSIYRLSGPKK